MVDVSVLIAGGGPVGLGLAIELGMQGIDCMVVERRDGTVALPKANSLSIKLMEINRRWSIAREVEAAGWPATHPNDYVYVTTMTGYELARLRVPSVAARGEIPYSPEHALGCAQLFFDPILLARARQLRGVAVRHHSKLESFTQDADRVTARLAGGETVTCRYLVGCDGAGSLVAEGIGAKPEGLGLVSNSINIFFRSAALPTLHDKGWARFYRYTDAGGSWGELIAVDGRELWRLTVFNDDLAKDADSIDADAYMRRLAGRDFDYEIISVLPWERREHVVDRYRQGRVFLAGDSAHQNSPTGALGMHTGLGDAVDLGWKLAAVLKGWGGEALLDTYEIERKPVAMMNVVVATMEYDILAGLPGGAEIDADTPAGAAQRRRFAEVFAAARSGRPATVTDNLRLNYGYDSSPAIVPDGVSHPSLEDAQFHAVARSGARAPHAWIAPGRSMLDLFGTRFVLLRLADAPTGALEDAARARGVPLAVVSLDNPDILALYKCALTLVRPDGHIAWRGDTLPADCLALIDRVRGATSVPAKTPIEDRLHA
jgi:2-polyprenyl-6-methoxyphenol hydroxylase-like FAD-dependent oxidoreductase